MADGEIIGTLCITWLCNNATVLRRGSAGAAGHGLSSSQELVIPARGQGIVNTGLSIEIPEVTNARLASRSGLGVKGFIGVGTSLVDADNGGRVGVFLFNHSNPDFPIHQ